MSNQTEEERRAEFLREAASIFKQTREKIMSEHPVLLKRMESLVQAETKGHQIHDGTGDMRQKNLETVMKFVKTKYNQPDWMKKILSAIPSRNDPVN